MIAATRATCPCCHGTGKLPPDIATKLRAARVSTGDGLKRAARRSGVPLESLSKYELGKRRPSVRVLDAYRDLYGLALDPGV